MRQTVSNAPNKNESDLHQFIEGTTEMIDQRIRRSKEIREQCAARMNFRLINPLQKEKDRQEKAEKKDHTLYAHFTNMRFSNGIPYPTPFEFDLHEIGIDFNFSTHFRQLQSSVMLFHYSVVELMRKQGNLAEDQILEFKNNANAQILINAVTGNMTPEQFLEIYLANERERLADAVREFLHNISKESHSPHIGDKNHSDGQYGAHLPAIIQALLNVIFSSLPERIRKLLRPKP
jgi:hypothetical protein